MTFIDDNGNIKQRRPLTLRNIIYFTWKSIGLFFTTLIPFSLFSEVTKNRKRIENGISNIIIRRLGNFNIGY